MASLLGGTAAGGAGKGPRLASRRRAKAGHGRRKRRHSPPLRLWGTRKRVAPVASTGTTGSWRRLRWSTEAALSHAAQHLGASAPAGRWAQSYMHRGMLLQARYDCARGECKPGELRRQHGLSCGGRGTGCILEVKAHVVFGRLSCIIVEQVPVAFNVALCHREQHRHRRLRRERRRHRRGEGCRERRARPPPPSGLSDLTRTHGLQPQHRLFCARRRDSILLPPLCAHRAAAAAGARRAGPKARLGVPGRLVPSRRLCGPPAAGDAGQRGDLPLARARYTCALRHWLRQYRTLRLRPTSGRDILARLQRILGFDNATFMLGASG